MVLEAVRATEKLSKHTRGGQLAQYMVLEKCSSTWKRINPISYPAQKIVQGRPKTLSPQAETTDADIGKRFLEKTPVV